MILNLSLNVEILLKVIGYHYANRVIREFMLKEESLEKITTRKE